VGRVKSFSEDAPGRASVQSHEIREAEVDEEKEDAQSSLHKNKIK
jgi:hypothetical protein